MLRLLSLALLVTAAVGDVRIKGAHRLRVHRRLAKEDKNAPPPSTPQGTTAPTAEPPSLAPVPAPTSAPVPEPTADQEETTAPVTSPTTTEPAAPMAAPTTTENDDEPGTPETSTLSVDLLEFDVQVGDGAVLGKWTAQLADYLQAGFQETYPSASAVNLVGYAARRRRRLQATPTLTYTFRGHVAFVSTAPPASDVQALQLSLLYDFAAVQEAIPAATVVSVVVDGSPVSPSGANQENAAPSSSSIHTGALIGAVVAASAVAALAGVFLIVRRRKRSSLAAEYAEADDDSDASAIRAIEAAIAMQHSVAKMDVETEKLAKGIMITQSESMDEDDEPRTKKGMQFNADLMPDDEGQEMTIDGKGQEEKKDDDSSAIQPSVSKDSMDDYSLAEKPAAQYMPTTIQRTSSMDSYHSDSESQFTYGQIGSQSVVGSVMAEPNQAAVKLLGGEESRSFDSADALLLAINGDNERRGGKKPQAAPSSGNSDDDIPVPDQPFDETAEDDQDLESFSKELESARAKVRLTQASAPNKRIPTRGSPKRGRRSPTISTVAQLARKFDAPPAEPTAARPAEAVVVTPAKEVELGDFERATSSETRPKEMQM